MLPSFVSSARARQWSTGLRHIVACVGELTCYALVLFVGLCSGVIDIVVCVVVGACRASWYTLKYVLLFALFYALPLLVKYFIGVGSSFSPSPDPVAWTIFILFTLFVLAVFWARGDFNFGPGYEHINGVWIRNDRTEQDDFRDEQHDGWEEDDLRYEYHDSSEENDFGTEYGDGWEEDNTPERQILDEDHRKQLKQLFRRAAQFCHPDKVPDHVRDAAHELFTQLNAAFQANDIEGVRNISDIARSGAFANPSR